jgi:hypothetical protein
MADDFSALKGMIYSGRGLTMFKTPSGALGMAYSLTGRSPPSQARELHEGRNPKDGKTSYTISTKVTDPKQLEEGNPALLLYPALVPVGNALVGSNGVQTELIYSVIRNKVGVNAKTSLYNAFKEPAWRYDQKNDVWIDVTNYEPDDPNFTPRISACAFPDSQAFHIVRRIQDATRGDYIFIPVSPSNGEGKLITTYSGGNETPLRSFEGYKPLSVGISSEHAMDVAASIYDVIRGGQKPEDNFRVAAAAIIRNKSGEVEMAEISRNKRGD